MKKNRKLAEQTSDSTTQSDEILSEISITESNMDESNKPIMIFNEVMTKVTDISSGLEEVINFFVIEK